MRSLSRLVRMSTGLRVEDTTSGFRCIANPLLAEFAASYPVHYLGDTFEAVIVAARAGYKVVEVPVAMSDRTAGTSTAGPSAALVFLARTVIATSVGPRLQDPSVRAPDERSSAAFARAAAHRRPSRSPPIR